jgi:hypothetical protein
MPVKERNPTCFQTSILRNICEHVQIYRRRYTLIKLFIYYIYNFKFKHKKTSASSKNKKEVTSSLNKPFYLG